MHIAPLGSLLQICRGMFPKLTCKQDTAVTGTSVVRGLATTSGEVADPFRPGPFFVDVSKCILVDNG